MPSLWLLTGDTQEHHYTEIYIEHNAKTTQHMCDQVVCAFAIFTGHPSVQAVMHVGSE